MATGDGLTVNIALAEHPVTVNAYTTVVVPVASASTSPELEPIVATAVLLLLQVPPPDASLSWVNIPAQLLNMPDIAAGKGLTVMVVVAVQPPVGNV